MLQRIEIILALASVAVASLGWLLNPIGYLSLVVAGLLSLHLIYDLCRRRVRTTPQTAVSGIARPTERELTQLEKDLIEIIDEEVCVSHNHYDTAKLIEDCLKGHDLATGTCHCGRPRNE